MAGKKKENAPTLSTILRQFNKMKKVSGFPMPRFAEMHITNRCNIGCYFCNQADLRRSYPTELSYDTIIKILSELKDMGLTSVMFSGGGEPTLHRSFLDIIQYLNANDITLMQVITNGMITDKNILDAMLSARWKNITFSLNASDENDWRLMTKDHSHGFETILNNIRYILAERAKRGSSIPRVGVKFGVDVHTWKKLINAYKLACDLGVDDLAITTYNHITYPDLIRTEADTIFKQIIDIYTENEATGRVKTISYYLSDLGADASLLQEAVGDPYFERGPPVCFMPWYGMMIATSGDVRPCASDMEDLPSMGNVNEESIRTIWNGRKYQKLRDLFEHVYFGTGTGKSNYKEMCAKLPVYCNPPNSDAPRCPNMACWNEFYYRLIC